MSRVERDPERGRAAAARLKALGVKGILIKAAEQGYITQLACKMPECFCPEELGGAFYFEPVTNEWSDWRSDWMPTHEHFPVSKKRGGKATVGKLVLGSGELKELRSRIHTAVYAVGNQEVSLRSEDGFPQALRLVDAILDARQAA